MVVWESHIVLACITCEKVILLTTEDSYLRVEGYDEQTVNLFLPTVCFSCEKDERKKIAGSKSGEKISMAMWTSLSISWDMIRMWEPYFAMQAHLEGDLSVQEPRVSLVQRDKVRDMIGSAYTINSVLLNVSTGMPAQVLPYLQGGFF